MWLSSRQFWMILRRYCEHHTLMFSFSIQVITYYINQFKSILVIKYKCRSSIQLEECLQENEQGHSNYRYGFERGEISAECCFTLKFL